MNIKNSDEARFWAKVKKSNGCWEWTGAGNGTGYGMMGFPTDGRSWKKGTTPRLAHRVSWEIANGPVPGGNLVLHTCDNRSCVRPSHLFLGTHKDNTHDMMKKGRQNNAFGKDVGSSKLTQYQADEIRAGSKTIRATAAIYGVSKSTIWGIKSGLTWVGRDPTNSKPQ